MNLGLIAGNGRFPFLVLDAARSMGHDVTVIALKEEASKEILTMDAMKKEIVYNLGLVYEQIGEKAKAIGCMKQIYEADYGFKDVAQRVESSYQEKSS